MSLFSINTNLSALAALQSLTATQQAENSAQSQVSSGKRVAGAADNPAIYAIAATINANVSGLSAVSDSLNFGAQVIATASTSAKRDFVLRQGASAALDSTAADLAEQVKALTGGRGVDLALDPSGGELFIRCLHALAPLGMAVSYNILAGMPPDVFGVLRQLLGRSLAVRTFSMHSFDAETATRRALMQAAIDLMARGAVQAPTACVLPLAEARAAHERLDDAGFTGKLVLHP